MMISRNDIIYLSIIVPVYKTEAFLQNCLDSICLQLDTYSSNVEVFVVNDGSPDNSLVIIEAFKEKYPDFINIINKKNGGLSEARNCALDKATGRYIWFVDSDDTIEAGAIAEIMPIISKSKADYIYFNAYRVDKKGRISGQFLHGCQHIGYEKFIFTASGVQNKFNKHMVWLRLFKREFVGSLRFPVGITHEDIHFDLQLLARQPHVLYLEGIYYRHFFDNPDSITNTMNLLKHRHILWIFNDLYEKFSMDEHLNPFFKEYKSLAISTLLYRAFNIPSTNLSYSEKCCLFNEYSQLVRKFCFFSESQNILINKHFFKKIVYFLIKYNHIAFAYTVAKIAIKFKSNYEYLSFARHRLKRILKSMICV